MHGLLSILPPIAVAAHEGWWAKNSGDFLVAIAAIFAAAIAAFVSVQNRNRELAQDRYLRDREHIRDTLDVTVATVTDTQTAVGNFYSNVKVLEPFREEQRQIAQNAETPEPQKLEALEKQIQRRARNEDG